MLLFVPSNKSCLPIYTHSNVITIGIAAICVTS
nr:MAG TPA: hypothetical protein [Caudoviricetes sp.]